MSFQSLSVFYDHIKAVVMTSSKLGLGITLFLKDHRGQSPQCPPRSWCPCVLLSRAQLSGAVGVGGAGMWL